MMTKKPCHACKGEVKKMWFRGSLVFCSSECRDESKNSGEPIPGTIPEKKPLDVVYINGREYIPG
jgi:hypothetical protein